MLDLHLTIAHHLLVFGIFGLIFGEFVALGNVLTPSALRRLARLDTLYGILALLVLVVGFVRVAYAAKGWAYYSHNAFFWAKILTFALVGGVSALPSIAFGRWQKRGPPDAQELRRVRMLLHVELTLFLLLPIFAALMARGYGQF